MCLVRAGLKIEEHVAIVEIIPDVCLRCVTTWSEYLRRECLDWYYPENVCTWTRELFLVDFQVHFHGR